MNIQFFTWINLVTLLSVVLLMAYAISTIKTNRANRGIRTFILILLGFGVCVLAAFRDGYGFAEDSVIPFTGFFASAFSLLGATMVIAALSGLAIKTPAHRKNVFILITIIFIIKFILMEAIRLSVLF